MEPCNLVTEPWIRVVGPRGAEFASLRQAIVRSHDLVGLDRADPIQWVAVGSLVTAVCLDVLGPLDGPAWADLWKRGRFDSGPFDAYFREHEGRFNLFDPVAPFMQVATLEPANGQYKPVSLLIPEAATGNNVPLFSSTTEMGYGSIDFASAARRLLVCHAYDTAAIKSGMVGDPLTKSGKTTGNPTGPVGQLGVVVPQGRNLFESIMLGLPIGQQDLGVPAWMRPPDGPTWNTRPAEGLLDLLTWQSRRVRLIPNDEGTGVDRVVLGAGDRLSFTPLIETRTLWRAVDPTKSGGISARPRRHQAGKAAWRGFDALTSREVGGSGPQNPLLHQIGLLRSAHILPADYPLDVVTVGVEYGNQSAVVEDVFSDAVPLPTQALEENGLEFAAAVLEMVLAAEAVMHALNDLESNLRIAAGGEKIPWDKGQRLGDQFLRKLNPWADRMLRGLQAHPETIADAPVAWETLLREQALRTAELRLSAAPPQTFLGRTPGKVPIRQQTAEAFFRAALAKALPAAAISSKEQKS